MTQRYAQISRELVDVQAQIRDLRKKERDIKKELTEYLSKGNYSCAEFTHGSQKYKASLCKTKVNAPLNEKEKTEAMESALLSIKNMTLDEKSKSQLIINRLKDNPKQKQRQRIVVSLIPPSRKGLNVSGSK